MVEPSIFEFVFSGLPVPLILIPLSERGAAARELFISRA